MEFLIAPVRARGTAAAPQDRQRRRAISGAAGAQASPCRPRPCRNIRLRRGRREGVGGAIAAVIREGDRGHQAPPAGNLHHPFAPDRGHCAPTTQFVSGQNGASRQDAYDGPPSYRDGGARRVRSRRMMGGAKVGDAARRACGRAPRGKCISGWRRVAFALTLFQRFVTDRSDKEEPPRSRCSGAPVSAPSRSSHPSRVTSTVCLELRAQAAVDRPHRPLVVGVRPPLPNRRD